MFFTKKELGRIYVLRLTLPDGKIIHKVGMTNSNRSVDRMMELLRSWFTRFRYIPHTVLKLDMECGRPKELEAHIHKVLSHKQFIPHMKVEGRTEMFTGIDEQRLLQYIRVFDENHFPNLELTEENYKHLGELVAP